MNLSQTTLRTPRLLLRPLQVRDCGALVANLNNLAIAQTLLRSPYPYTEQDALSFVHVAMESRALGMWMQCGIDLCASGALIGSIGLSLTEEFMRADVGYWISEACWNRGYATEALQAMIDFGFSQLGLIRIQANHFSENPSSGRVMQKAGMTFEGMKRKYFIRFGQPRDVAFYGILREDWEAARER